MSYTSPWIPRADGAFRSFAEGFCRTVEATPAAYMVTRAEAAWLMQALQSFESAFRRSSNLETRTRGSIADKDDARSVLQNAIQNYAAFIRVNRGITDADKLGIGVRPRNTSHKRRTCPHSAPLLNYVGSLSGIDQLVYHDSNTPESKAKPYGVERLELWVAYAKLGDPLPRVSQANLVGSFKKSKMIVAQDAQRDSRMEGESKPTYWARWVGFDGSVGPWSLPCRLGRVKIAEPSGSSERADVSVSTNDWRLAA